MSNAQRCRSVVKTDQGKSTEYLEVASENANTAAFNRIEFFSSTSIMFKCLIIVDMAITQADMVIIFIIGSGTTSTMLLRLTSIMDFVGSISQNVT